MLQQEENNYLRTANQILIETFGEKRILLNDHHRGRLAVKNKILGRTRIQKIGTLFNLDTILRWHRENWLPEMGLQRSQNNETRIVV